MLIINHYLLMLNSYLIEKLPKVIDIFKKYKIIRAYAFGSVCSDRFNDNSDIDLLIAFQENLDPLYRGQSIWDMEDELKLTLNRDIDLLTETQLKNPYLIKELNETKIQIYG